MFVVDEEHPHIHATSFRTAHVCYNIQISAD